MSDEKIDTVRRSASAFNRGDLDAWIECWADDIDYRAVEGAPDDHGPILGKDALRDYAQDWRNTFDDFRQEPVEQIDAGDDKVIAVFRVSGRAKLSGVETDLTYAALYTFRDGKIARGREYWTRDEALEAAGLPPSPRRGILRGRREGIGLRRPLSPGIRLRRSVAPYEERRRS